jgi:hypothetical protein
MPSQSVYYAPVEDLKIDGLRAAIQANQVTFPVPVPVFIWQHRADVQWRLAELYFVHGWSPPQLGRRYRISCSRVRQSLRNWVNRAKMQGYLQPVPAEEDIRPALTMAAGVTPNPVEHVVSPVHAVHLYARPRGIPQVRA